MKKIMFFGYTLEVGGAEKVLVDYINELQDKITSYREPYKCETCTVKECDVYALGCRDCSGWK